MLEYVRRCQHQRQLANRRCWYVSPSTRLSAARHEYAHYAERESTYLRGCKGGQRPSCARLERTRVSAQGLALLSSTPNHRTIEGAFLMMVTPELKGRGVPKRLCVFLLWPSSDVHATRSGFFGPYAGVPDGATP